MSRLLVLVLAALAVLTWPASDARAQQPPQISASIDAAQVEVGEPFSILLSVSAPAGAPEATDPRLVVPAGMTPSAPSVSSQTQINFGTGGFSRRSGITATWRVVAGREGTFTIDGPTVAWNGQRLRSNALRITVVAAGSSARSRRAAPQQNPFDPFGMFPKFPSLFDSLPTAEPALPETSNPDLALDAPLDETVFLRAIVSPKTAVVGEQVTLSVYVYDRGGAIEITDPHEPSAPEFLRKELISATSQPDPERVTIAGAPWRARLLFQAALFPLRAGNLEIGSARATIGGGVRMRGRGGTIRQTPPVVVHVTEPPLAGRPVGYEVGDVGAFSISAAVEPRTTEVGGAVAVTVTVAGTGNVPRAVKIPTRASLEWLEPQTREAFDADRGRIRGSRSFTYVVRPKSAGDVDLGEVSLPFWNPDKHAYETARARLGGIKVAAGASATAGPNVPAPHDPWGAIGAARSALGTFRRPRPALTDRAGYWLALLSGPLAIVMGTLVGRGAGVMRARIAARRQSPARSVEQALGQAREAMKRRDAGAVAAALDRGLHVAIEAATGVRARGLLIDELPAALQAAGLGADLSVEVQGVLSAIEVSRFTPDASEPLPQLVARAENAAVGLGKATRGDR